MFCQSPLYASNPSSASRAACSSSESHGMDRSSITDDSEIKGGDGGQERRVVVSISWRRRGLRV
ncbi:hypothetical protein HETIRDRAFT_172107 [Heterobasidion irregulare TC 32-1]|uniref:Uncharacterized protein n=1 Tax=Heterobasidion irregulare (strain TC 32-1) TaxID=747525 RepID=W4JYL6_HETIT|nr:uncharacterized protein HETIRDRAFT_172107 [Heterobasidion irregulare TC 32-1]ETW78544.1 hypothetical protein HETIRDRAFT_172107 [Heterobasidion irregulare TC 32-1]